jgi:hypothetical protein
MRWPRGTSPDDDDAHHREPELGVGAPGTTVTFGPESALF